LNYEDCEKFQPVILGGKNKSYQQKLPHGVRVIPFDVPSVRGNVFYKIGAFFQLLRCAKKLRTVLQAEQANILFTNTPRAQFVAFLGKLFFPFSQKWIFMVHDFSVPVKLFRAMGRKADKIIVNSLPCRNFAHRFLHPSNQDKIRIIENFIDFKRVPQPSPPRCIQKILILGRLDPQKGQIHALEAAKILAESKPHLEFLIVGSPFEKDPRTTHYAEKLHAFSRQEKLKNVRFLKEVDLPFSLMREADIILALPTKPETFGRIVIEALALGKLVLSFDETGPREILHSYGHFLNAKDTVGKSVLGFLKPVAVQQLLVEKENSESLVGAIRFFVDNPAKIEEFTKYARLFVEKNFSAEDVKKKMMYLFLE